MPPASQVFPAPPARLIRFEPINEFNRWLNESPHGSTVSGNILVDRPKLHQSVLTITVTEKGSGKILGFAVAVCFCNDVTPGRVYKDQSRPATQNLLGKANCS